PSIDGRCIILQRIVSRMTQYLAVVQGMPKEIKDLLDKKIRMFTWDNEGNSSVGYYLSKAPIKENHSKAYTEDPSCLPQLKNE
ncbi:hypothetical protein BV22DRAFT_1025235, partial [Leucogyrophana mollusca]